METERHGGASLIKRTSLFIHYKTWSTGVCICKTRSKRFVFFPLLGKKNSGEERREEAEGWPSPLAGDVPVCMPIWGYYLAFQGLCRRCPCKDALIVINNSLYNSLDCLTKEVCLEFDIDLP